MARFLGVGVVGGLCISASLQAAPNSTPLEIGNPNPVGSGARALALGNAFVALADDATAANWNPGGLSQLTRPEVSFALQGVSRHEDTNIDFPTDDTLDLAEFNYVSAVLPFDRFGRHMVFSLSYLNQFRFDKDFFAHSEKSSEFQTPGPIGPFGPVTPLFTTFDERNDRSHASGSLSSLTPALGFDIGKKLSLGVAVNIWNDGVTGNSAFSRTRYSDNFQTLSRTITNQGTGAKTTETMPRQDLGTSTDHNQYAVDEGYSFSVGALYRVNQHLSLGVVVKPAYTLELDHQRVVTQVISGATVVPVDLDLDSELEFPWVVAAGAAIRPNDQLTVSADLTWTQWSEYRFRSNGVESNPFKATATTRSDDTLAARLGCEYVIIRNSTLIPLLCGVGYDPTQRDNVIYKFYTVSVGAGIQLNDRWNIDFAYEYRWGNDVNEPAVGVLTAGDDGSQDVRRHSAMISLIRYF
jgi:long-subunit fatty acid transport protein